MAGISQVKQFKMHIVQGSRGIQDEADNYSYVFDKMTGLYDTNEAVDENNHAMDAIRYATEFLIAKYRPGKIQRKDEEKRN